MALQSIENEEFISRTWDGTASLCIPGLLTGAVQVTLMTMGIEAPVG